MENFIQFILDLVSDEFYQYFSISVGEISPIFDNIVNINDLAIYVVPEEIEKVEEYDADSTYNTYISSGRFFVRNLKTKKDIEVKSLKKKELYIEQNNFYIEEVLRRERNTC